MKINKDIVSYDNFSDYIKDKVQVSIGIDGTPTFFLDVDEGVVVGHCLDDDAEFLVAALRDIADAIEADMNGAKH